MPATHTICRKTELILERYLLPIATAQLPTLQFIRRFVATQHSQPVVKIVCTRAEFEGRDWQYQTGNATIDCDITLITNYADTDGEIHDECIGLLIDNLLASNITTELNAVDPTVEWTCNRLVVVALEQEVDEHMHKSTLRLMVKASPSRTS